jgi:ACS family pantothenate transporter-like MFS transporter
MSWATITMAKDAEECAIVGADMNALGQAMTVWVQIFQYPAISAPNFRTGFISNLTIIAQFLSMELTHDTRLKKAPS